MTQCLYLRVNELLVCGTFLSEENQRRVPKTMRMLNKADDVVQDEVHVECKRFESIDLVCGYVCLA